MGWSHPAIDTQTPSSFQSPGQTFLLNSRTQTSDCMFDGSTQIPKKYLRREQNRQSPIPADTPRTTRFSLSVTGNAVRPVQEAKTLGIFVTPFLLLAHVMFKSIRKPRGFLSSDYDLTAAMSIIHCLQPLSCPHFSPMALSHPAPATSSRLPQCPGHSIQS